VPKQLGGTKRKKGIQTAGGKDDKKCSRGKRGEKNNSEEV
jgi:hypothetical protein